MLHRNRLLTLALPSIVALSLVATSAAAFKLALFPEKQMAQMGTEAYTEMKAKTPISKDKAATARVMCVANALTREVGGQWEVNLFATNDVNAFALPGGKIGVYEGLLKVAVTPAQLAAVLGHEIGHVQAQHSNQRMSTSLVADLGMKVVQGFTGVGQSPTAMAALGLGAQYGVLLPFSRGQETEADKIGIRLMARAGFNPDEAVTLWQNMKKASGGAPPEILSTHPSNNTRIKELSKLAPAQRGTYEQAQASGKKPAC